jgi:hypothetical protein
MGSGRAAATDTWVRIQHLSRYAKKSQYTLPRQIPQNFVIVLIIVYVEASELNIAAAVQRNLYEQNLALLSLYLGIPDCRYGEDSPR